MAPAGAGSWKGLRPFWWKRGSFIEPHLRKEGLDREEVEMAIREHGLDSATGVRLAVLETDGSISIVPGTSRVVRSRKHVRQLKRG